MKINITKIRKPTDIVQNSSTKYKREFNKSSLASYIGGIWSIVTKQNSADITVDVKMRNGIELRHIKVRSLEWSGYNSERAFGERDLPPLDSKVFIMLPDGPDILDTAFVLCGVIDTVWEVGEEAKKELAVSGKAREKLRITEAGVKETYNKDTGAHLLEINGAQVEITATGAVNVTPASGQSITLNNGTQGANDLPSCLFSGALHCLDALQTVKVP